MRGCKGDVKPLSLYVPLSLGVARVIATPCHKAHLGHPDTNRTAFYILSKLRHNIMATIKKDFET